MKNIIERLEDLCGRICISNSDIPICISNSDILQDAIKLIELYDDALHTIASIDPNSDFAQSESGMINLIHMVKNTIALGQPQYNRPEKALEDLLGPVKFTDNFLLSRQFIPLPRETVFSFFSKAENLEILTPPWLKFKIMNQSTPEIRKGTLINYKLRVHGAPVRWRTLIGEWKPNESFVDTQLKGPYKKWYHVHRFEDVPGGTLITDDVTYEIPGWIFGKLILPWIKRDVSTIFAYRQEMIQKLVAKGQLN